MKKIFTLIAAASVACAVNAQEVWHSATLDAEGKVVLNDAYTVNPVETEASVATFETASVKGEHVSGAISQSVDGSAEGPVYKYANTWGNSKKDLSKDGSVPVFCYVNGQGNAITDFSKLGVKPNYEEDGTTIKNYTVVWDEAYYQPDGSNGLPVNGTYVKLTPAVKGTFKVGIWVNKGNRAFYVVANSTKKALEYGKDYTISGYINGQNNEVEEGSPLYGYVRYQENIPNRATLQQADNKEADALDYYIAGPGNQAGWFYINFTAEANETYWIFNQNTQIGFEGYEFTPDAPTAIETIAVDENAPVEYYNLQGVRVINPEQGLYIKRQGSKVAKVIL